MAKQQPKVKVATKVTTIEDVQRSLQEVEKRLNELSLSVNQVAESQSSEGEGKSGDLKIVQNQNKSFSLEGCTDEGWKRLYSGEGDNKVETFFYNKQANVIKPVVTVNKWDSIPKPDYDSGWFNITVNKQYVTGATDGVVPDTSFAYTASHVVGIPALGFSFTEVPSHYQIQFAGYNVKSFDNAMTGKILMWDGPKFRYHLSSTWYMTGTQIYMTSPEHIVLSTGDNAVAGWSFASQAGGTEVSSSDVDFYDSFDADGSSQNIAMKLLLWK
jgi:predicted RNA binding protein with dsRBD fold (UPF0201 family)